jgi:sulfoxide reductase heme-binding subunit YedZ
MVLSRDRLHRLVGKPLVHAAALTPLALLVYRTVLHPEALGANPVAVILDVLGLWALRLLLVTLALTPLRWLTKSSVWLLYRRLLGLWSALYALLHLAMYVIVDQRLDARVLLEDVLKRPWITVGFATVLILLALSLTSTRSMMRRLGRRWQTLHNAVYVAGLGAVWHYWWQVKKDVRAPLAYAAVLALLLGYRLVRRLLRARSAPATVPGRT